MWGHNVEDSARSAVRRARFLAASLRNPGRLKPGPDFSAGTGLRVGRGRTLATGTRVHIGNNFCCMANLSCGSDVMISSNVSVVGNDHPFDSSDRSLYDFERNPYAEVVIEGDNLIGFGTSIVGPLTIGFGAIVGTGSVVTKDLEPNGIYAGVPARRIGTRR